MTRKIAVSLPDHIAARVAEEPNVSAYIADAVQRRIAGERTTQMLTGLGFDLSPEKLAKANAEYEAAIAGITPELRAAAAALFAQVKSGRP